MIAPSDVTAWSAMAPWATPDQIEQDLVLSRLMVEFARHPVLGPELTMRGGTCLHKLWLPRPYRYSEDLDYVRTTTGGVGHLIDAVRQVAEHVGCQDVRSRIGIHPKIVLRTISSTGAALRVKVEMNTFERSPSRPTTTRRLEIASSRFTGTARRRSGTALTSRISGPSSRTGRRGSTPCRPRPRSLASSTRSNDDSPEVARGVAPGTYGHEQAIQAKHLVEHAGDRSPEHGLSRNTTDEHA